MELIQKKFPNLKRLELEKNRVKVFDKTLSEELEYSINYLELGNCIIKKKNTKTKTGEIFLLVFFVLEFSLLIHTLITDPKSNMIQFWLLASGLFLAAYLTARFSIKTKLIYITGGSKYLELYQDKPNKVKVDEFILHLQLNIKEAYKKEYLKTDEFSSNDYIKSQIDWLKRINIIDEVEAKDLILNLNKKNSSNIGFT